MDGAQSALSAYGLIGLWVTALAPWLFEKIHLNV